MKNYGLASLCVSAEDVMCYGLYFAWHNHCYMYLLSWKL